MDKRKVMVIDDEEDIRKVIRAVLEGAGDYEVLALPDATDIIGQLKNFKPDIILLDVMMPEVNGLDARAPFARRTYRGAIGSDRPKGGGGYEPERATRVLAGEWFDAPLISFGACSP